MAADGGWVGREDGLEPATQLRRLLQDLQTRTASPDARLPPHALRELIDALQAVSRQAEGRNAALVAAIAALSARLDALDSGLAGNQVEILQRLDRLAPEALPEAPPPEAPPEALPKALTERTRAREPAPAREPVPVREPWVIRATLIASTALALVAAGAAVVATFADRNAGLPSDVAGHVERLRPMLPTREDVDLAPPRAIASDPPPVRSTVPLTSTPEGDDYAQVAEALRRGETTAIARLTGLAERGDARARLHLAGLYETGGQGLPRDLAAARLWTRRAAGDGDRVAMHNLGLFLMEGQGGARDDVEAVAWFRRAAERGVVDSQFNLAVLYEAGRGVPANLREAYRWFAIAANAGDASARDRQVQLEARLTPAERASLDRDVRAFTPGARPATAGEIIIPPATTVAESQALLARRGYYLGPLDGAPSPAYATAVSAFLADHPTALAR